MRIRVVHRVCKVEKENAQRCSNFKMYNQLGIVDWDIFLIIVKGLSPFPPFQDYQKYIPVKCTPFKPRTQNLTLVFALHIIPSCLQFIIPSYYSFHCNLQFTVDMEWGSLFSGGITFFHVQLKKSDPLLLFSNNGSHFFSGITFFHYAIDPIFVKCQS